MSSRVERQGMMLFADIMDSASLSYFLAAKEYDRLIDNFHSCSLGCVEDVIREYKIKPNEIEYGCAGDELKVFLIAKTSSTNRIKHHFKAILDLAFRLKIMWLFSNSNRKRLKDNKAPTDVGVGIHCGPVMVQVPNAEHPSPRCEGYSITLCKRTESASRHGNACQIFLTQNAKQLIESSDLIHVIEVENSAMKGIPSPPKLYEVTGFVFFDVSAPYEFLVKLVRREDKPFEDWSKLAMQICRQSIWYGLLTITLLHIKQKQKAAIHTAEEMVQREENFSLFQYLGFIYDRLNMPERAVLYNQKALNIEPYDIMAQFNLAVALSHTEDSEAAIDGKSRELWQRIIHEYKKTEHLLKAHGGLGAGSEYDWKIPLFTAYHFKGLASESLWERTHNEWQNDEIFSEQEKFWLREARILLEGLGPKIKKSQERRGEWHQNRWLSEWHFHRAEVLKMLGETAQAKRDYESCIKYGEDGLRKKHDRQVESFVKQSKEALLRQEK